METTGFPWCVFVCCANDACFRRMRSRLMMRRTFLMRWNNCLVKQICVREKPKYPNKEASPRNNVWAWLIQCPKKREKYGLGKQLPYCSLFVEVCGNGHKLSSVCRSWNFMHQAAYLAVQWYWTHFILWWADWQKWWENCAVLRHADQGEKNDQCFF